MRLTDPPAVRIMTKHRFFQSEESVPFCGMRFTLGGCAAFLGGKSAAHNGGRMARRAPLQPREPSACSARAGGGAFSLPPGRRIGKSKSHDQGQIHRRGRGKAWPKPPSWSGKGQAEAKGKAKAEVKEKCKI